MTEHLPGFLHAGGGCLATPDPGPAVRGAAPGGARSFRGRNEWGPPPRGRLSLLSRER